MCIRMYLNPLLVNPENSPVPPEFVRDIFVNIQRIFKLTCEFLKKYYLFLLLGTCLFPLF